jgi:hypothetical protein
MADPTEEKEAPVRVLDADDIALLKTYGIGPYANRVSPLALSLLSRRPTNTLRQQQQRSHPHVLISSPFSCIFASNPFRRAFPPAALPRQSGRDTATAQI